MEDEYRPLYWVGSSHQDLKKFPDQVMDQAMHRQITPSSGNVFADMGHPHPQKALAKAKLAGRIATIIEERGLTQEDAAKILGLERPEDVSLVVTGRLRDFTIDQLTDFLTAFNEDVEITVRHAQGPALLHVTLG